MNRITTKKIPSPYALLAIAALLLLFVLYRFVRYQALQSESAEMKSVTTINFNHLRNGTQALRIAPELIESVHEANLPHTDAANYVHPLYLNRQEFPEPDLPEPLLFLAPATGMCWLLVCNQTGFFGNRS